MTLRLLGSLTTVDSHCRGLAVVTWCHPSVLPMWDEVLVPRIKSGERVLIVAHGNSLRALIKHIDGISDKDIINLNLPTGTQR